MSELQRISVVALAKKGGTVLYASELTTELTRYFDVQYIGALQAENKPARGQCIYYDLGVSHPGVVWGACRGEFLRMRAAIAQWHPDAIWFPLSHPFNFIFSESFRQLPQVATIHDAVSHPGATFAALTRILHSRAIRRARAVAVLSEFGAQNVSSHLQPGQILKVIPHPVFQAFWEEPTKPPAGDQPILFFGRWERYKGLEILARAAVILDKRGSAVRLMIAGAGTLPPDARQLAELSNVSLVNGYLPAADVTRLVIGSRAIVLPYTSATQSGVVGIAFAALKPVIASAVGGLAAQITDGQTGILVPPGDPAILAAALERMWAMSGDGYRLYQHHIRRQRHAELSTASVAAQYSSLLQQAMGTAQAVTHSVR